ncbi:MAG: sigma-70 family RNA polymerase sigma factor [Candidatus Poribacteria bacterium]|nr:sigma-70 family RNA polymerase sigma factor [Candidatus Poribacteria bacterium]
MVEDNVQLIRRILSGDDEAFSILMRRHQNGVHALIWRKIEDFHIAEEITQDTFIQVYKKLGTLEDPNRFEGWLYVIANRRCLNWIRRNKAKTDRLNIQSLEATRPEVVEQAFYRHHISHQREVKNTQHRQNLAKRLLQQLPESERTVVTLYYLGNMKAKEISKFLGVSVNTIKSRLRRARKRLQDEGETLIRETLKGVQLSDNLIENVMRYIADLNPTPAPPAKKPLLPWAAFGAAVALVILLGMGSQYLLRFQQPYSFDAQSEPTVELVDEPILIEIVARPDARNQIGRTIIPSKNSEAGRQISQSDLTTNAWDDDAAKFSTSQWTQSTGPKGGVVYDIFKAADGTIYTAAKTGLYRLTPNATWVLINTDIPTGQHRVPITEHQGTLYTVSADEVLASEDSGETWNPLGQRPKGTASGLIVTDASQKHDPQANIVLYLALQEEGIFRSTDAGQRWMLLNNGLAGKRIYTIAAIGNTLFAGTNRGLYRLSSSNWQQLITSTSGAIYALTVDENNLYVGIARDIVPPLKPLRDFVRKRILHSADLGASWTEITPTDESQVINLDSAIQVVAAGKTLLVLGITEFRSIDGGKTWTVLRSNISSYMAPRFPAVVINENTFYKADAFGISRTTNAGASWHPLVNGMTGPLTHDLIALNNRLYMHIGGDLVRSADGGETWESVHFNTHGPTPQLDTDFYANIKLAIVDNRLYVISIQEKKPSIFRTSVAGDKLIPIHGVPDFEAEAPPDNNSTSAHLLHLLRKKDTKIEAFAVGGGVFYAQYRQRLFKWRPGNSEWIDTGLVGIYPESALAISGETVYVGKPNGKLFQSVDSGDSWKDITSTLPIAIGHFKEMTFADSKICIATDKGVLISENGEYWRVITNKTSMPTVIDRFAVDGTTVYGVGDSGAYRLDAHSKWELLSSEVPSGIESLVISNDRLYVGTRDHGMFHISLEAQIDIANAF